MPSRTTGPEPVEEPFEILRRNRKSHGLTVGQWIVKGLANGGDLRLTWDLPRVHVSRASLLRSPPRHAGGFFPWFAF